MYPREIPVACVQVVAHDRNDFARAWPHLLAAVDEACASGAKLVVLPEGSVPGYVLGSEPVSSEQLGDARADLAARARRHAATIVYGAAKIVGDRTYNAAIVLGPDGHELGYAAKQFLWHFDRRWYAAGETLEPIATPLGNLGLLVCADGRIPTIAATLCDRGAELLVMPTAWVTSGRDPLAFENIQADFIASIRARENGVPFVAANKVGVERASVAYCGKSAIFDADGATIARGDETHPSIVRGTVEVGGRTRPVRRSFAPASPAIHEVLAPLPSRRIRVAFTCASDEATIERHVGHAADGDADVLIARGTATTERSERGMTVAVIARHDAIIDVAGLRIANLDAATLTSPRALVETRLAGIDCFIWHAGQDDAATVAFARSRAAELRAYVLVFASDERGYIVDPDGVVAAGTFARYTLASFVYDPARTAATTVAPTTDVLAGLRTAERIAQSFRTQPFLETPRAR